MATYTLPHEVVDGIIENVLIADYQMLGATIAELESSIVELDTLDVPEYKKQDLADDHRFRLAIKTLLGYYLTADRYLEVVGEPLYD